MTISTMDAATLVRLFRLFRDELLQVGRVFAGPEKKAAGVTAAKLDQMARDVAAGKRTRSVIDTEFSRLLLSLGMSAPEVLAALIDRRPDIDEFLN